MALAEDRRARRARHHPAHLVRDVVEPVLHQRQGDGIEFGAHAMAPTWTRKSSRGSTSSRSRGPTKAVVVRSCDQQRAVELAARPEIGAVVDRHVVPAMGGIDPDLALFARLGRRSLRRRRRGRRPVEQAAADHAQRGDAELAARLDVAEQPLMLGLERLPRRGGIEGRAQRHAHRPLLAVVAQVDLARERGRAVGEAFAAERFAGARFELGEARVEARRDRPCRDRPGRHACSPGARRTAACPWRRTRRPRAAAGRACSPARAPPRRRASAPRRRRRPG